MNYLGPSQPVINAAANYGAIATNLIFRTQNAEIWQINKGDNSYALKVEQPLRVIGRSLEGKPDIDLKAEAQLQDKFYSAGVSTPKVHDFAARSRIRPAYIVMDLLPEGNCLAGRRIIDDQAMLDFARALTTNLAIIHRLGYVHGDPSRRNTFYDPNSRQATMIDFGLAQKIGEVRRRAGNCGYIPPEMLLGYRLPSEKPFKPRTVKTGRGSFLKISVPYLSKDGRKVGIAHTRHPLIKSPKNFVLKTHPSQDLFSLGVVLYRTMAGTDPFPLPKTDNQADKLALYRSALLANYINESDTEDPTDEKGPSLESITNELLTINPKQRPQTAGDLLQALSLIQLENAKETTEKRYQRPTSSLISVSRIPPHVLAELASGDINTQHPPL